MKNIILLFIIFISGCATSDTATIFMLDQRIKRIESETSRISELEKKLDDIQIPNYSTNINSLYKRMDKVEKSFQRCVQDYVILKSKMDKPKPVTIPIIKKDNSKSNVSRDMWLQLRNGSKKRIILRLIEGQLVGPKGEYYNSFPTDKEIKLIYYE